MTEKLKTYFELKAIQCGVSPIVLLTPYLAEVSNRMARSEIKKRRVESHSNDDFVIPISKRL